MLFKEKTQKLVNDESKFNKLEKYVEQIQKVNEEMNLTKFEGDLLWKNGIYESIVTLEQAFDDLEEKKLLDFGSGAGFPSIPYVIVHPEVELIIFEPQMKKLQFLIDVIEKVQINGRVQATRVEDSKMFRYFDYITCRAVSKLKNILEVSNHVGKMGAKFAFIKGPKAKEEVKEAKKIAKIFSAKLSIEKVQNVENKEVNIVSYIKAKSTPKGFPREWKKIIKDND